MFGASSHPLFGLGNPNVLESMLVAFKFGSLRKMGVIQHSKQGLAQAAMVHSGERWDRLRSTVVSLIYRSPIQIRFVEFF